MTTPMGHLIPSPERPRVPYIPNIPGEVDQILHLDENAQPEWADVDTSVFPSGADPGDVLAANAESSGGHWNGGYMHKVASMSEWFASPPYTVTISDSPDVDSFTVKSYQADLFLASPSLATWTLDLVGGGELYDYSLYSTAPPVAAAATVVTGALSIGMPALTLASPLGMQIEVRVVWVLTSWSYRVETVAWNAAGDVEQTNVRGIATLTGPDFIEQFEIDGLMSSPAVFGDFWGV